MSLTQKKSGRLSLKSSHISEINHLYEADDNGLGWHFFEKLNEHKDKIHQVDATTGFTETNGSVRSRSIQVAVEMQQRKVHENDVVVICSRTHSDQTIAVLASLLIGAIVAPLDPNSSVQDLKNFIVALKPSMVFCDVRMSGQIELITKQSPDTYSCQIVAFGDRTDRLAFEKFLVHKASPEFKATAIKDSRRRVAFIVASQSTAGPPKLVCISHYAIRLQTTHFANKLIQRAEKILSFFPLSWITQVLITCYCYESTVIKIIAGEFCERTACKLIHNLEIDHALLGTQYALRMVRHESFQDYDLSCLKVVYIGGTLTPAFDVVLLRRAFSNAKVLQCYGTTEMSGLVTAFSPDDYAMALQKPGSIGRLLPGIKIKIVNIDTREILTADWWGELTISAPTLMLGYYKDVVGTNAALEKGYFKTSDVAQFDTDGYLYMQGRTSDYILQSGNRRSPAELEELILTHPDVTEVAVIGDEHNVIACVVKASDSQMTTVQLTDFISERLPEDRCPTKIKFMEDLPKTNVGKIKKQLLKQQILGITIEHSKSVGNM